MSSSNLKERLRDILDNILRVRAYILGMTRQQLAADHKTQDAIERCLERICEAARKIGDVLDAKYPAVEFPKLRQLGSVLRHDYDEIDTDMIWRLVPERLDALENVCRGELSTPST